MILFVVSFSVAGLTFMLARVLERIARAIEDQNEILSAPDHELAEARADSIPVTVTDPISQGEEGESQ